MSILHYDYNLKNDLLTVYHKTDETKHLLGSISISNTSTDTKEAFMLDMLAAKEKLSPSKAPWHANELFDDNGRLITLNIRRYGSKPQWYLKRGDKIKTEVVKPHQIDAQVEYYTQQICFEYNIPTDVVSYSIVKHAIKTMYRDVALNNN